MGRKALLAVAGLLSGSGVGVFGDGPRPGIDGMGVDGVEPGVDGTGVGPSPGVDGLGVDGAGRGRDRGCGSNGRDDGHCPNGKAGFLGDRLVSRT